MNKNDLQNIFNFWASHDTIEDFARKSGELADRVHALSEGGHGNYVLANLEEVTALFAWQARTFGGEWDMTAVAETMDWLRQKVQIVYTPERQPVAKSSEDRAKLISA